MDVCVDIQSSVTQRAGVGRYTRLLVEHLARTSKDDRLRLCYFDFKRAAQAVDAPGAELRRIGWCPGRAAQFAWKTFHWPPFDWFAGPADLYHFPNFIIPPLRRGKTVVTIHDLGFMRFPQFAEEGNLAFLRARIHDTVRRADAILAVSRFCADEISRLLLVDSSRVFPVHHGISPEFREADSARITSLLERLSIRRPYLLTVGTVEPRKNLPFLVEVFEKLTDFDGSLVIAGMPGWKYEPIIERMRISRRSAAIRYIRYVPDADLPALYSGADLFVLPSFYEGFGFPPLEAMACGTPVVSSSRGALREVLDDGAVLLDEFQSDIWVEEVRRALSDSAHRQNLIAAGRRQAARYSWTETARKTWDVYRKVAS